jgi:UDP-N-acetylmuramyl tripeptide synthase
MVLMTLSPGSLRRLARARRIVLVSGTNGKSTTARLIAEAWSIHGPVTANEDGANLVASVASALLHSVHERVVLEVDELALPAVIRRTSPELVVLLNLGRDQLDRVGEVSRHVRLWQEVLKSRPVGRLVVNADDPMLVVAVLGAVSPVTWVSAGLLWQGDARVCRRCRHDITFDDDDWWCAGCGLRRPQPQAVLRDGVLLQTGAPPLRLELELPGAWNRANAAVALVAARELGVDLTVALRRMGRVPDVSGRFARGSIDGHEVRLLLAKNPASARSVLELVAEDLDPVVLVLNAEAADGRDPSWLWDVPFEQLRDRPVFVTGRRAADISVRLHYAQVQHQVAVDLNAALAAAGPMRVHVVANYSAFRMATQRLAPLGGAA